jgi:glucokinase
VNGETSKRVKYVIGVDMGGTKILAALVNRNGKIISRAKKRLEDHSVKAILGIMAECVNSVCQQAGVKPEDVGGIGIGAPGTLDFEKGIVVFAPNLHWRNVPLRALLEKKVGIRTFLDNDVNLGTLGEYTYGVGKGARDAVGIFIGTGIGGGIILDGKLFYGYNKTAGEIGHMVLQPGGPKCGCGNRGCLEALASRTAIARRIWRAIRKGKDSIVANHARREAQIVSGVLAEAVRRKDEITLKSLHKATRYIGIAVGNLINLLNPEMIILGGGVMEALGPMMLRLIRSHARKNTFPQCFKGIKICSAKLGDDAGVLGGAALVLDKLSARSRLRRGYGGQA